MNKAISVETIVNAPIARVWSAWNEPRHIIHWAFASDDWEAPFAQNDVREGGKFKTTMAAKDGRAKFDFEGTYTKVKPDELIEYTIIGDDVRAVRIEFTSTPDGIRVRETFDLENINSEELQRGGWQSIISNFKKHAESNKYNAIEFLHMVIEGKIDEAYAQYVAMNGKHHNSYYPSDFATLKEGMQDNEREFPHKEFEIKRALEDRGLVVTHSHMRLSPEKDAMVVVHMFRFENGKIVEMWDCGQVIPKDSPNKEGAF